MALILHVRGTGPGQALIDIAGAQIPSNDLEIAIQRTDDNYVGTGGNWQATPAWHRLQRSGEVTRRGAGPTAQFLLGPEIVDPLAEVVRADSFRAQIRWEGGSGEGTIGIRGELFASAALMQAPMPASATIAGAGPLAQGDSQGGSAVALLDPAAPPPAEQSAHGGLHTGRWILGLAATLSVLALAAWLLGWLTPTPEGPVLDNPTVGNPAAPTKSPGVGPDQPPGPDAAPGGKVADVPPEPERGQGRDLTLDPEPEPEPEPEPVSGPGPGPGPESGAKPDLVRQPETAPEPTPGVDPKLSGSEYVGALVGETKDATIYMQQAERRAERGDCNAVHLLYDLAAKSNPRIAGEVARLYDPEGFKPSRCITHSSEDNAMEYYALAAESGETDAKRRLGQLLIKDRISGPDYDEGLRWLRDAESAGDQQAKQTLDDIKYRSFENRQ